MSSWTSEQLSFLQSSINLSSGERYRDYVARFGQTRSYDSIERQVRRLRAAHKAEELIKEALAEDPSDDLDNELDLDIEVFVAPEEQELKKALGRTAPQSVSSFRDRMEFGEFVDNLIQESLQTKPIKTKALNSGTSLCILLSDTHIGKMTENFDKEVFTNRLLSIPEKIQKELTLPSDLQEIVVLLAGDMLEGEGIYDTQAHHIEMPAIDQVQIAIDAFWKLINLLKETFNVRVRVETCPGNHGRVSKTSAEKSNWDNIIYQTLGYLAIVAKDEKIVVNVNFDAFHTFQVQDKTGMLFHHGTKHLGTGSMQAKVAGWLFTKEFDFMCHGHWHEWAVNTQFGKLVMKNGSLPGDDDLSERMGCHNPPRQGWLLVRKGQPINQVGFFEWQNEE